MRIKLLRQVSEFKLLSDKTEGAPTYGNPLRPLRRVPYPKRKVQGFIPAHTVDFPS